MVVRDGAIVAEWYGTGQDWKWNESLGVVAFGPTTLHDLRSVSKSVTALLYGVALDRGRVPAPDQPLLPHFPAYADVAVEPAKQRLTVWHALTMSLGIEWHEDVPYTSTANSEIAMEFAPDRYRFVLGQTMAEEPGQRWHYCGGATAQLGRLIADGTRQPLQDFARDALFTPVGITSFEWMAGADGIASPASGLRLAPRDLARIGQLVLQRGRWDGQPVVPEPWLNAAVSPQIEIEPGFDYGYQWYLGSIDEEAGPPAPLRFMAGIGNGGQRLFVLPEVATVIAIASGSYDSADQTSTASAILELVLA